MMLCVAFIKEKNQTNEWRQKKIEITTDTSTVPKRKGEKEKGWHKRRADKKVIQNGRRFCPEKVRPRSVEHA